MTLPSVFAKDPRRTVRDAEGLNAGPPPGVLLDSFVTPAALFFTRSHAPTPSVNPAAWTLRVDGLVERPLSLTLDELTRDFEPREVTATMICAGLRRDELMAVRPIPGELAWGADPVSTGHWGGVSLRDVLLAAAPRASAAYVELVGGDTVERHGRRFGFWGSIPLAKALGAEVLLATLLNGAPLPPEHGFPVRAVVPGFVGARSVKWLSRIEVRATPSDNYFQTEAYRVLKEPRADDPRDVRSGVPMGVLPLNSVIVTPEAGARLASGPVRLKGWAYGGDERTVARVEVSANGADWAPARIVQAQGAWAWQQWEAELSLAPGRASLMVRAWDNAGGSQPERLAEVWNVRGYGNNAWHRVPVVVLP